MKVDFKQIKDLLQNGNLAEVARETGIAYRTLQDWKLENNKWLQQAEERLTKIQNYIEANEVMKKYTVLRDLFDDKGNLLDNEVVLKTDVLGEAKQSYKELIGEIEFYDHEKNGASLLENLNEDESESLDYYVYEK